RERFFAGTGDVAADPDFTVDDDIEAIARLAFLEDHLAALILLLLAYLCDPRKFSFVQVGEDRRLLEELEVHGWPVVCVSSELGARRDSGQESQATPRPEGEQGHPSRPRRGLTIADGLTLSRIPLALIFLFWSHPIGRIAVLAIAGATDLLDGFLARRVGSS